MPIISQNIRLQLYNGTSTEWEESDLILRAGEPAYESDTTKLKIGDGRSLYKDLPYISVGEVKLADFTPEEREKIQGPPGPPGKAMTYNDLTADQRSDLKGEPGESITIKSSYIDDNGDTVITFSDSNTIVVQRGAKGDNANIEAGQGISKNEGTISIDESYVATKKDLNTYAKKTDLSKIVELSQEAYDALPNPDPDTHYFITVPV